MDTTTAEMLRNWQPTRPRNGQRWGPEQPANSGKPISAEHVRECEALTPGLSSIQLRYGPDAQGGAVPAFAVLHLPMTQAQPQAAVECPREPGEHGSAFHFRARVWAWLLATQRGIDPAAVLVHFLHVLPLVSFRQEMAERYLLRWHMQRKAATAAERTWAATKMAEVLYGVGCMGALYPDADPDGDLRLRDYLDRWANPRT